MVRTTNKSDGDYGFNEFVTKINPSGSALLYSTFRNTGATLKAKTTYYYQVVVTIAGGTTTGAVQSLTTN